MKFSARSTCCKPPSPPPRARPRPKSPISALEGLLIEAGSGVRVTGYDLKKGIY